MSARAFLPFVREPDLLERAAQLGKVAVEEAETLSSLLGAAEDADLLAARAKEIEHRGDQIVHSIVHDLNRSFFSPFDRGDIHQLASALEDVIDFTYGAADRIVIYKVRLVPHVLRELVDIIIKQAQELTAAVGGITTRDGVFQHCATVKQLEADADELAYSALSELFEREIDPIQLIKIKELIAQLSSATDRAKAAADVIEAMTLKQGIA